jgi:hypothetical protein
MVSDFNSRTQTEDSSPNIARIIKSGSIRWEWCVAHIETKRNAYRVLLGKPEGKRPPGRSRHKWEG